MEQSVKIAVFSLGIVMVFTMHTQMSGPLLNRVQFRPGRFNQAEIAYVSDAKSYVNGGVTFTYPKDMFKTSPTIIVSVELINIEYAAEEIVMAIIVSNDAYETIVRVNRLPLGIEACTDDVIVHLHAIGE